MLMMVCSVRLSDRPGKWIYLKRASWFWKSEAFLWSKNGSRIILTVSDTQGNTLIPSVSKKQHIILTNILNFERGYIMGGKRASKSELFLMELIFSILFFSIASAVCVTLFVHARLTSIESTQLTTATLQAQSAAETFKSVECRSRSGCWPPECSANTGRQLADFITIRTGIRSRSLTALPTFSPWHRMIHLPIPINCSAQIQVSKQGKSIYELTVTQYVR